LDRFGDVTGLDFFGAENLAPEFWQFVKEQDPIAVTIDRPILGVESLTPRG
jgi:hypothetical protein